jgi:hypothetical protein
LPLLLLRHLQIICTASLNKQNSVSFSPQANYTD